MKHTNGRYRYPTNNRINPSSIGPEKWYRDVALMCMYSPRLWSKVSRLLNKVRRQNGSMEPKLIPNINGKTTERTIVYCRQAFQDTILPWNLQIALRTAIHNEFDFDPDPTTI